MLVSSLSACKAMIPLLETIHSIGVMSVDDNNEHLEEIVLEFDLERVVRDVTE